MDPVTHAASGAIAMLVLKDRPATAWAWPIAALACASPDLDLLFCSSPLNFLLLHRGITHSLAGAPFWGLLLALLSFPLWRRTTPNAWKFRYVWLFCIAMILLHIWLDVVTTYGTMIFLPFSHYRVRLNSVFIIDLLITIPLLWALLRWRAKRGMLILVMCWTFLYPAVAIAINAWHTSQCMERLAGQNRRISRLHVLPDAFSPLFWRVIYEEEESDGPKVYEQSLDCLGKPRSPATGFPAAPARLVASFEKNSTDGDCFFHFALLPLMEKLPVQDWPTKFKPDAAFLRFYDLRFGSGIEWVKKLLASRPDADLPFLLMAELSPPDNNTHAMDLADLDITRIRLRFSDSGRDSQWHEPEPGQKPSFLRWLVGLR